MLLVTMTRKNKLWSLRERSGSKPGGLQLAVLQGAPQRQDVEEAIGQLQTGWKGGGSQKPQTSHRQLRDSYLTAQPSLGKKTTFRIAASFQKDAVWGSMS